MAGVGGGKLNPEQELSTPPHQQEGGLFVEEGGELTQHCVSHSQPPELIQKDTVINGIESQEI